MGPSPSPWLYISCFEQKSTDIVWKRVDKFWDHFSESVYHLITWDIFWFLVIYSCPWLTRSDWQVGRSYGLIIGFVGQEHDTSLKLPCYISFNNSNKPGFLLFLLYAYNSFTYHSCWVKINQHQWIWDHKYEASLWGLWPFEEDKMAKAQERWTWLKVRAQCSFSQQ